MNHDYALEVLSKPSISCYEFLNVTSLAEIKIPASDMALTTIRVDPFEALFRTGLVPSARLAHATRPWRHTSWLQIQAKEILGRLEFLSPCKGL